jgi:hypothetical protein
MHTPAIDLVTSAGHSVVLPGNRPPARGGPWRLRVMERWAWWVALAVWAMVLWDGPRLVGGPPEPDAIVYGTVAVDGRMLTVDDTAFRIEARRSLSGPGLVTTRVGAEAAAGGFYVLRLPVEAGLPLVDPRASLAGDDLVLVVTSAGTVVSQRSVTIPARGEVQRVDLGEVISGEDQDKDGLPDAWEQAHYGALTYGPGTLAANGGTLWSNYLAGTNPNDPESLFVADVQWVAGQVTIVFSRRSAAGVGYEGRSRFYALQSCEDVDGVWEDVPGYARLPGDGQTTAYVPPAGAAAAFYRAQVWLE